MVKRVNLSGPTSFAPIINKSLHIIRSKQQLFQKKLINTNINETSVINSIPKYPYHILFIIADGKVSPEHENETVQAIVEASEYPLSIVMVGVGDGPFDTMIKFDDRLCSKSKFDNFQFVDFHHTMKHSKTPDTTFALRALMEIPEQFRAMKKFNYV